MGGASIDEVTRGGSGTSGAGHVLIGTRDEFIDVDHAFAAMMHCEPDTMIGRAVMQVTAPADRAECAEAIGRLRRTLQPFKISKRFLRDDGSLIWVTNSVSITGGAGTPPIIVATIQPIEPREERRAPGTLLEAARYITTCRRERARICDTDLLSEPAWEMMLAAYMIEAEGQVLTVEGMAARAGTSMGSTGRWLTVLLEREVLELELGQDRNAPKSYRLSAGAHRRFENYLTFIKSEHEMLNAG